VATFVGKRRRGGHRGKRQRPAAGKWAHTYAALDLGTNNCRLLVARPAFEGFRVIDAFSRIVRLGEGLRLNGALSDEAMERTLQALKICAGKMRRRRVTRWRAVATEACRRASNCEMFIKTVSRQTGLGIEIISTQEEAHLALYGCAPLLDPGLPHALVFDIGGGSTELMWLHVDSQGDPWCVGWTSLPHGVVTLAELYGGRTTNAGHYAAMVDEVYEGLLPFDAANGIGREVAGGRVQMLGTSGTVTTVAGVHLRLPRYNRAVVDGSFLNFDDVARISQDLAEMEYGQRVAHPCIGPERADLVVAGCAILAGICRLWPVGRLRVADRGVREGILLRMIQATEREAHAGPVGTGAAALSFFC
jgi:exopolyphosphatase/guanosine-5'-triphosphate,3'-diphosphate pyrophosphatase